MKTVLTGWFCLLLSGAALAATPAPEQAVQASMLVTGSIVVAPDGSVAAYTLDHADKLSPAVRGLLDKAVPTWTFHPVLRGGKPVTARSPMDLRIVARSIGGGKFSIGIRGARFGTDGPASESISYKSRRAPSYPWFAALDHVSGTVYLLMRINRQGVADDLAVEQVNLMINGSPALMKNWRQLLAKSALKAAKYWTFNIPSKGPLAKADHWIARVAVNYRLNYTPAYRRHAEAYGKWQSYIPGPRQLVPWAGEDEQSAANADVLPDGAIDTVTKNQGLRLITALDGQAG